MKDQIKSPAGFQLRIALREIMPPIWRRFLVPATITLPGLHRVIQEVMGWENYHLHRFRFGEKEYGAPDPDYPTEMRNERGRHLREFLRDEGAVFGYEYDFGNDEPAVVPIIQESPGSVDVGTAASQDQRARPSPGYDLTRYDINNIWVAADLQFYPPKVTVSKLSKRIEYPICCLGLCLDCDQIMGRLYFATTIDCIFTEYQLDCITEYQNGGAR